MGKFYLQALELLIDSHMDSLLVGGHLTFIYLFSITFYLYYFIIKDTNEQPGEGVSRVRSRRVLSPGAFAFAIY